MKGSEDEASFSLPLPLHLPVEEEEEGWQLEAGEGGGDGIMERGSPERSRRRKDSPSSTTPDPPADGGRERVANQKQSLATTQKHGQGLQKAFCHSELVRESPKRKA